MVFTELEAGRGQAAARLNRRAATPNAIRVSVINDRVNPVSGTAVPRPAHDPGVATIPAPTPKMVPRSNAFDPKLLRVWISPDGVSNCTSHATIEPLLVANWNMKSIEGVRFVNVCTPSENVNEVGVNVVSCGCFSGRGLANVTIPDMKLLLV